VVTNRDSGGANERTYFSRAIHAAMIYKYLSYFRLKDRIEAGTIRWYRNLYFSEKNSTQWKETMDMIEHMA